MWYNTNHDGLKSTPLRLYSTNIDSSAIETTRLSKIESRIELEMDKLLARISD